jgi:hypothetical protein
MSIPLEKVYDVFYSHIQVDLAKHPELDVGQPDNLVETYLDMATYDYEEYLGEELIINKDTQMIENDIPKSHIRLLGDLIYKNYIERELNFALKLASDFNKSSELKVTGSQAKIVALRDILNRIDSDIKRSFTKNVMKRVVKGQ